MVLVSGSADNVAIWDLDNLVMRYKIPVHDTQVNHIQLQVRITLYKKNLSFGPEINEYSVYAQFSLIPFTNATTNLYNC